MKKVGTIREIWRYPVKGMGGEQLETCSIGEAGIAGDRIWAMRDTERGEIQSCKFRPELLGCIAETRESPNGKYVEIGFPEGIKMRIDDIGIHEKLSELVGRKSTMEQLPQTGNSDFFKRYKFGARDWLDELKDTFTREAGEPMPDFSDFPQQAKDFVTVPGSFFLVSPFHIITSATMKFMKTRLPGADWDIRRFRPNIVIDTNPDTEGLAEQDWVGRHLTIGNLSVFCTGTAVRCGAVTRAQQNVESDKSMLRTIVKEADQNLGIYGRLIMNGTISVGDNVSV